jgi:peroxiredoxin Q/BCP
MKLMKHLILLLAVASGNAEAALDLGEPAPDFTARAALGGEEFEFSLRQALKKGPVVLYFFPASFSEGCSVEAHNFAEAIDQFKALGATVIGVSRDEIDAQKRFSVSACRGKFAVAADPEQKVMRAYDAVLTLRPEYANRVTYLIAPNSTVAYQSTSLNPDKHVQKTLAALREWAASKPLAR